MSYIIETTNLTKKFAHAKSFFKFLAKPFLKAKVILAVDSVELKISEGELFGIVGLNGAGKTTLIKILCCLIQPTEGTAKVAGFDILNNEERVKASIGLVSGDERSFYWRLTGRQNLNFFASLYSLSPSESRKRINELSSFLGIEKELDKRFYTYSAGIKQRLSIIRSLLNNPRILFMDEPTKSLDPIAAKSLRAFIKNKLVNEQKITVIYTTHNLNEVEDLDGRLTIMDKGRIRVCGTIPELRNLIGNSSARIDNIFTHFIKNEI